MRRYSHQEALKELTTFKDLGDSGSGYFEELAVLASRFPEQKFSIDQLDWLVNFSPTPEGFFSSAIVFAKAGHTEVLPYARKFFNESETIDTKLEYAAVMAQLGDETGYQYIEDVFQRFMRKEDELKDFDMEQMVFIFNRILTNERGQEMLARFRKEADYYVVWETLEYE
jgi:hypothetical protein